jgi:hypothetical protein
MSKKAIFLSASVPLVNRSTYHETANAFLIQCAVREFIIAAIRKYKIVWGGHPAITPMVWSICEDLGIDYSQHVILYQSRFFEDRFPEENERFKNVIFTDSVENERDASLYSMRESMLSRDDLVAAVFVGGMEGVEAEYTIFNRFHPSALVLPVASPGGASLKLAQNCSYLTPQDLYDIDYARLFHIFINSLS